MQLRGRKQAITAGGAVVAMALLAACSSSSSPSTSSSPSGSSAPATSASSSAASVSGTINAAGSTFQGNFQQAAIQAFGQTNPNIKVNYDAVGSGTGRTDLYGDTVLIAGSDCRSRPRSRPT